MQKLVKHTGIVFPLDLANVDTDQLVPKQFLKRVSREGYGQFLFFNWRFLDNGEPNPEFSLNFPRYRGASIILSRENFGSGSSREHAPWAILDYGFRVLIAPSFADIFKNNCFKNGLLPIELGVELVDDLFARSLAREGYALTLDLPAQTLTGPDGFACSFAIDPFRKRLLVEGLDEIGLTLAEDAAIRTYESRHRAPWRAAVAGRTRP